MYNPLHRTWLMNTSRIHVTFRNDDDVLKEIWTSGFWMKSNGRYELRFVTNRHSLDYHYKSGESDHKLSSVRVVSFDEMGNPFPDLRLDSQSDTRLDFPSDPKLDIAVITVSGGSLTRWLDSFPPSSSKLITVPLDAFADDQVFKNHEQLPWGALVSFTSYQEWMDKSGRPILRTGYIASDPLHDYESEFIERMDQCGRREVLLLEASSFAGSSGSLVIANSFGQPFWRDFHGPGIRQPTPERIVGIMCGHILSTKRAVEPGLSYCHKSTCLRRILLGQEKLISTDMFANNLRA